MPFSKNIFAVNIFATILVASPATVFSQTPGEISTVYWGTHMGSNAPTHFAFGDASITTSYFLWKLAASGAYDSKLSGDTGGGSGGSLQFDGDLVELGFFDTDPGSGITPLTDSDISNPGANLFQGTWTPLTSKTQVGQDVSDSSSVGDGEFFHSTRFVDQASKTLAADGTANTQWGISDDDYKITNDQIGTWSSNSNDTSARVEALNDATNALVGIRFYDNSTPSNGVRYNTIMNESWLWLGNGSNTATSNKNYLIHQNDGTLTSGLTFEFDNTDHGSISKVGTSDLSVDESTHASSTLTSSTADFVSTVTYYDGSEVLATNGTSHVLSGLNFDLSTYANAKITGDGNNALTIHSNEGNSFVFEGDIEGVSNDTKANTTIVKTGSGKQTLSGDVRLGRDSNTSGWININEGTLSLSPGSGKTVAFEYLTGAGGILELNNTSVTTVELGFANTTASQNFDGNVSLVGSNAATENVISIGGGYNREQNMSGVISGSNELAKDGEGRLVLKGSNTNSGDVEIKSGTLVAANAQALGNTSNSVTITKGKLEVADGITLNGGYSISAGNSNKTMIGGDGSVSSVTIGSGSNEIDTISPGQGISSSISSNSSQQQISVVSESAANGVGEFNVTTLNLNNGAVYDWEIADFTGSNPGADWDLLNVGTLNFDSTSTLNLNIFPIASNGTAGAVSNHSWTSKTGTNGFKILDFSTWNGTGKLNADGIVSNVSFNNSSWLYYNNDPYADWSVWYDHSDTSFYLQYSVAPEPSTYVMVTGLMLVPGMNAVRKYRNRKKKQGLEEPKEEIVS
jgi:autotransporter-associated beta strand protein